MRFSNILTLNHLMSTVMGFHWLAFPLTKGDKDDGTQNPYLIFHRLAVKVGVVWYALWGAWCMAYEAGVCAWSTKCVGVWSVGCSVQGMGCVVCGCGSCDTFTTTLTLQHFDAQTFQRLRLRRFEVLMTCPGTGPSLYTDLTSSHLKFD